MACLPAWFFLAACSWAAPGGPGAYALEPPPGWRDVTSFRRTPAILLALKGPETGSFVLARVTGTLSLENQGVVRAFLTDALAAVNKRTGLGFKLSGDLMEATYGNGLTARYIRADLKGKPRLILAVADFGGAPLLATLVSAVPETMLPEILGALRTSAEAGGALGPRARSLDGQLEVSGARDVQARALTEKERRDGFVLALRGLDSELLFMKLVDDSTPAREQAQIVKNTALSVDGVDAGSLSRVKRLSTPAGPGLIYVSARVKDGTQFVAGYLPWCYWGYSVLARGPQAAGLVRAAAGALSLGPSAQRKLVANTVPVPVPGESWTFSALAALAVILVAAAIFFLNRPKGESPPVDSPPPA